MKKLSLKTNAVATALVIVQMGCSLFGKRIDIKAEYIKAQQLEQRGGFMKRADERDSAFKCYNTSIAIYRELLSTIDSITDTTYNSHLAQIYNKLGLFDSMKLDARIAYFIESLRLAKIAKLYSLRLADEQNISNCYFYLGQDKSQGSPEQKTLFDKATKYMLSSCMEIDSADDKTELAIETYDRAHTLFENIGDTVRRMKYLHKYTELKYR